MDFLMDRWAPLGFVTDFHSLPGERNKNAGHDYDYYLNLNNKTAVLLTKLSKCAILIIMHIEI